MVIAERGFLPAQRAAVQLLSTTERVHDDALMVANAVALLDQLGEIADNPEGARMRLANGRLLPFECALDQTL